MAPTRPTPRNLALKLTLALALLPAIGLAACGSQPPRLQVRDVAITDQTEQGVVVTFRVDAENRNPDPLPLRNVRYGLSLDGKQVFTGTRAAETTLRRYGVQEVLLPVAIAVGPGAPLETQPTGSVKYAFWASAEYEEPGTIAEVLFDNDVRVPTASFSERGTLNFDNAAKGTTIQPQPESTPQ